MVADAIDFDHLFFFFFGGFGGGVSFGCSVSATMLKFSVSMK